VSRGSQSNLRDYSIRLVRIRKRLIWIGMVVSGLVVRGTGCVDDGAWLSSMLAGARLTLSLVLLVLTFSALSSGLPWVLALRVDRSDCCGFVSNPFC
jgi:hypothetical protein